MKTVQRCERHSLGDRAGRPLPERVRLHLCRCGRTARGRVARRPAHGSSGTLRLLWLHTYQKSLWPFKCFAASDLCVDFFLSIVVLGARLRSPCDKKRQRGTCFTCCQYTASCPPLPTQRTIDWVWVARCFSFLSVRLSFGSARRSSSARALLVCDRTLPCKNDHPYLSNVIHSVPDRFRSAWDMDHDAQDVCSSFGALVPVDVSRDLLLALSDVGSTIRCGVPLDDALQVRWGPGRFRALRNSRSLVRRGGDRVYGRCSSSSHARSWGLARWEHDPFPRGRFARHTGGPNLRIFYHAPVGDLPHRLSECPAFDDVGGHRSLSIGPSEHSKTKYIVSLQFFVMWDGSHQRTNEQPM